MVGICSAVRDSFIRIQFINEEDPQNIWPEINFNFLLEFPWSLNGQKKVKIKSD